MGKALSGKLSCPCDRSCLNHCYLDQAVSQGLFCCGFALKAFEILSSHYLVMLILNNWILVFTDSKGSVVQCRYTK